MNKTNLGAFLKDKRERKSITLRKLSEIINYSYTYISSVENEQKVNPSQNFLESYIYGLADNNTEIMELKKEINSITKGKYFKKNDTITINKDESIINSIMKDNSPVTMIENKKGITSYKKFAFPVNDIAFHLNDKYNSKYFRKLRMTDEDREYIYDFINNYYIRKVKIQKEEVIHNQNQGNITDEMAERYIEDYNTLIKRLENPNDLKY